MKAWYRKFEEGLVNSFAQYMYNLGTVISQIFNTLLGGDPDESFSSRTGKAERAGKWWFVKIQAPLINWFFQDDKHCLEAIEDDEGKKQIWDWCK